ncbi:MAG: hypothetical protein U5L08_06680 [Xanthomonadales bacterium]|nr:hypothetical protein [Xanthomonadales bacterium]
MRVLGRLLHVPQAAAGRRLRRRHHRALDDGCVADGEVAAPVVRQHFDRHLRVHLRPAQVDQHGDADRTPDLRRHGADLLDIGAQATVGVAAAGAHPYGGAHHLVHHLRRASGDLGGVRDDRHGDQRVLAHDPCSATFGQVLRSAGMRT